MLEKTKVVIIEDDVLMSASAEMLFNLTIPNSEILVGGSLAEGDEIVRKLGHELDSSCKVITILDGQFPIGKFGPIGNYFGEYLDCYKSLVSRTGKNDYFIANSGDDFCNESMVRQIEDQYGGKAHILSNAGKPNAVVEGVKKYTQLIGIR